MNIIKNALAILSIVTIYQLNAMSSVKRKGLIVKSWQSTAAPSQEAKAAVSERGGQGLQSSPSQLASAPVKKQTPASVPGAPKYKKDTQNLRKETLLQQASLQLPATQNLRAARKDVQTLGPSVRVETPAQKKARQAANVAAEEEAQLAEPRLTTEQAKARNAQLQKQAAAKRAKKIAQ